MKNEKNLLETQSGNLPKELVLKALLSLTDVTDLARAMMANSFLKKLVTNDPNLIPMTLTNHVKGILDILKPISQNIEATNFNRNEKILLTRILEREIYQRLFTLFKNKTQQEKNEAFMSLKEKLDSDIKISFLSDPYYADIKVKDRLFLRCAELGLLSPLEHLLIRKDIDPAAGNNYAIRFASSSGHLKVVDRLLKDKDNGVNPAALNNYAICRASKNGHTEVVKALLNHHLKKHSELSIDQLIENYKNILWGDITKDKAFIEAIKKIRQELKLEHPVQQSPLLLTQYTHTASPAGVAPKNRSTP